jgi:aspartate kinase
MAKMPVLKFGGVTLQGKDSDRFRPDMEWLTDQGRAAQKLVDQGRKPESLNHFIYRLIERQRNLARRERLFEICRDYIVPALDKGQVPVVVVSAFDWATDKLVHLAECITPEPDQYEYARLLMSGELRANSALAIVLNSLGIQARSLTGREAGIFTTEQPTKALIEHVDVDHLRALIARKIVPVVAGFQGYYYDSKTEREEVSILGRGGSNLTAVALAHHLGETECVMYSNVDGLYDKDPETHSDAVKIKKITATELLKWKPFPQVIQKEAVEYAQEERIDIWIRSGLKAGVAGSKIICRE